MTTNQLLLECFFLKDNIMGSQEYNILMKSEKEMLNDEYVQLLIQYFQTAQSFYNDAVRFQVEGQNEYAYKFSQAKTVLYTHPLVKNYLNNLEKFNHLLDRVSEGLFGFLQLDSNPLKTNYRKSKIQQNEEFL